MKTACNLLGIIVLLCGIYAQETVEQEPEKAVEKKLEAKQDQGQEKKDNKEEKEEEKEEEEIEPAEEARDPEEDSIVEKFFMNPGFQLLPRTRELQITNTVVNSLYYDSNVFLQDKDREDDTVYAFNARTVVDYKIGRYQIELSGIFRYEYYFDHDELNEFLPRAELDVSYHGELYYARLKDNFVRYGIVNTLEINDHSVWVQNDFQILGGVRYKRWLAEVSYSHTLVDFRKIRGDYQYHVVEVLGGYKLSRRIYFTTAYAVDKIDYKEANELTRRQRSQEDSWGHSVSPGVEIQFTRNFIGRLQTGIQLRDSETTWAFRAGVNWFPTSSLSVQFDLFRGTLPSVTSDFKTWTNYSMSAKYLITETIATKIGLIISHSNPDEGNNITGYFPKVELTTRIYRGIEGAIFYHGDFIRTKERAGDYNRHQVGGSVKIVF